MLKSLKSAKWNNTAQRAAAYLVLRENMPLSITKDEALQTLEIVSTIITRSHSASLNPQRGRFKDLLPLINNCFKTLRDDGMTDLRDINDKYVTVGKAIDFGMRHRKGFFFDFILKVPF